MIFLAGLLAAVVLLRLARQARDRRRWVLFGCVVVSVGLALWAAPRGMTLRKTIGVSMMPMGLLWFGLLIVAVVAWWRARHAVSIALLLAWLGLTVSGNEPLANRAVAYLEDRFTGQDPFVQPPFEAVIVLGGGTADTPWGREQLGRSGDRLALAARLYHRARAPVLVISGSPIVGFAGHDAVAATRHIFEDWGVAPEAIVEVMGARTTGEEARLHAALIRQRGWTRVGVISSARHLPRAEALFAVHGVHPVFLPADVMQEPVQWLGFYSLVPNAMAAAKLHSVWWEIVGRVAG